jgi:ABC-type uncharacterized transport system substrate-binding protein
MTTRKPITIYFQIVLLFVITGLVIGCSASAATPSDGKQSQPVQAEQPAKASPPAQKFKILHIMSYHSPWEWTDGQLNGFKAGLKDAEVEYKVIQMDTKHHSDEESKQKVAQEAKDLIKTWQPDLVYTTDDDVQKYIIKDYINNDIPFVFSGVNTDPAEYGFVGSKNITGVIEHQHFIESVELLKKIAPEVKKIAIVVDDSPFWKGVTKTMKAEESQLPAGVEIVSYDLIKTFAEYQQKVKEYQTTVDAIGMLGVFNFKDENGQNVPFQDVLKWTTENSQLPDFSFWEDRISHGTLASVTVSSYEQGLAAGQIARAILLEGQKPADIPMEPTVKGVPVINLAKAKALGFNIDSDILLAAKVIQDYSWEKP